MNQKINSYSKKIKFYFGQLPPTYHKSKFECNGGTGLSALVKLLKIKKLNYVFLKYQ
ncbi:hypothetical protein LEP1GSC035_4339 [Leptospira noguchii str. 2007001578]|uniref:Uncharacterized protein n=1 Tax=Leptospira noguchii str. 2007001578 TaxID=1049974 RepID=A0ABN0J032_9LEPT|nr:hypothetical protein LEP1GSC035_4339 [Leptospira noguchii str. 2007001578]